MEVTTKKQNKMCIRDREVRVADMAASFQERIAQILAKKLLADAADTHAKTICLEGGVAAHGRLRQLVNDGAQKLGAKVYLPELKYCGDNGAMIAMKSVYELGRKDMKMRLEKLHEYLSQF